MRRSSRRNPISIFSTVILAVSFFACSSPPSYVPGSLTEPYSVAVVAKEVYLPDDPLVPLPFNHNFAYITDVARDTVKLVDTSLRVFEEAPVPYFPLLIPVGARPTRLYATPDSSKIYVLNSGSEDISMIDTTRDIELGAEIWNGQSFTDTDPATGLPLRIYIGLPMSDLAVVRSASQNAGRLYIASDNLDMTGGLVIIDTDQFVDGGSPNPMVHKEIGSIDLPGVAGRIDVSQDGDTVFSSNRNGNTVFSVNVPAGTVTEIPVGNSTSAVRYVPSGAGIGNVIYAVSNTAQAFWLIDLDALSARQFMISPTTSLGSQIPSALGSPQFMTLASASSLGGLLSVDPTKGCPGYVGLTGIAQGPIGAFDVSGCAVMYDADGGQFLAKDEALSGLPVEASLGIGTDGGTVTANLPTLTVNGVQISTENMYLPQYPHIDFWDNPVLNYGFSGSTPLRMFTNGLTYNIIYEGRVANGNSGIITAADVFTDPQNNFISQGVLSDDDWLLLTNSDGSPRTKCDDGTTDIGTSIFDISIVNQYSIEVDGTLPGPPCINGPTNYEIRPLGEWFVQVAGFGPLGRAVSGTAFNYPSDGTRTHFSFTVRDPTDQSKTIRNTTFSTSLIFYPLAVNIADYLLPTDIVVASDPIYPPYLWAFIVYSGSSLVYQLSPRFLDPTIEYIYQ